MGVKINAQKDSESEYVKALYIIRASIMGRVPRPWLWLDVVYNLTTEGRHSNERLKIVKDFTLKVRTPETHLKYAINLRWEMRF